MTEMVTDVSAPGSEGDFGVKAGHMAMVSSLRPGVLTITAANQTSPVRYFVAGGFADVNATSCTILAEQAVDVLTLNVGAVAAEVDALTARLALPMDEVTAAQVQGELALARARLAAAQGR